MTNDDFRAEIDALYREIPLWFRIVGSVLWYGLVAAHWLYRGCTRRH